MGEQDSKSKPYIVGAVLQFCAEGAVIEPFGVLGNKMQQKGLYKHRCQEKMKA